MCEIMRCHWKDCPHPGKEINPQSGYVCMLTVGRFHRECFIEYDKDQSKRFESEMHLDPDENLGDV